MDTSVAPVVNVDLDSLQSFAGKTIIVTGASSGIGLEIAEFFYDLGCNVVFVGGRKRPDTYVDLDSSRTLVCQCDISSWDSQVEIFEAAKQKFGHIDIICLNAGIAEPRGQFFDVKVDQTGKPLPPDLRVLDVDLKGTVYGVALGFHYLREGGGTIIMVTSRAGYGGNEIMPGYSAAKNGATGLLRSLAGSAKEKGIALTIVAPHITFTPGVFPQQYKRGKEAFDQMRTELQVMGINLSSSRTCAIACAYLVNGGLEMSGTGLLVENDEIYNIEQSINDNLPAWFKVKSDTKAAREEYIKQMERDQAVKTQAAGQVC
ncbi:hypothetical protein LTR99_001754 [Exophiala xenobiotica]|uniref:Uncharacterized protein n=1 Tax=Vermiconidia calcicola TaxID=1690605 RepID=A0AAV9Q706_9PEZI|nr:hypothetical protein LTR92_007392 [Exophiala xenobiotica]KAK5536522.1 hypothetical protein LTR25_005196 [Vermiconidia calcicola]KAK5543337.1 hypothetical protein LTR23_004814 [Chaetothyriales sp. CCFEE 6169]KAK5212140.1 hypothetical protein LTR41_002382 [Exophiala xenobiotica]KAK5272363.1 hypothetical protein LTR96_001993 [Exophiala xenobiotica]